MQSVNNLSINPQYTLENCPPAAILIMPGGIGTRRELNNPVVVEWIKSQYPGWNC